LPNQCGTVARSSAQVRAASLLKPHEPHPATIPHQSTTPNVILALASTRSYGRSRRSVALARSKHSATP
jgi:hypothetical protein